MISYDPLWRTMKEKGGTTYTLRVKGDHNGIVLSSSSLQYIKAGKPLLTTTLDLICRILDCAVSDIIEYRPD